MKILDWLRNKLMPERKARMDATQRMDASYTRFMAEVHLMEMICHDLAPDVKNNKRLPHDHH